MAFGGIAGLFLGCSLISAMELLYFALVELPVFVLNEFKAKDKLERTDQGQQQQNNQKQIPLKRRNWGMNNRIVAAQNFQNDFTNYKNNLNSKNEGWSQQYYLTSKHNF